MTVQAHFDPEVRDDRPVREDFLVFGKPFIEESEIEEVVRTLRSGWLGTGPRVREFEHRFADYVTAEHAIAVNSCTAGLHLALKVLGVGPGDEVITTPMTFAATGNVILHCGATPVFVDIDRNKLTIDPAAVEQAITSRTKALLPVHFGGRSCDLDALRSLADRHGLYIVEDAAHAIETVYRGRKIGAIGDVACFSFYVTKSIVTGEGGMVTTKNPAWAERLRILSLHGLSQDAWSRFSGDNCRHYEVLEPGYKYNMTDLQAALGLHQLARVEANYLRRRTIWDRYDEAFRDLPVYALPPESEPSSRHALHLYTLLLDLERLSGGRDVVRQALHDEHIGTGVHYRALHLHSYYRDRFEFVPGMFPNAEWISDRTLSLPLSPQMTDHDVDDVIFAVRKVLTRFHR